MLALEMPDMSKHFTFCTRKRYVVTWSYLISSSAHSSVEKLTVFLETDISVPVFQLLLRRL